MWNQVQRKTKSWFRKRLDTLKIPPTSLSWTFPIFKNPLQPLPPLSHPYRLRHHSNKAKPRRTKQDLRVCPINVPFRIYVYVEPYIVNRATTVRIGESRNWPLPPRYCLSIVRLSLYNALYAVYCTVWAMNRQGTASGQYRPLRLV